jgi:hypothetical protein
MLKQQSTQLPVMKAVISHEIFLICENLRVLAFSVDLQQLNDLSDILNFSVISEDLATQPQDKKAYDTI